jgi:hypothetical protein
VKRPALFATIGMVLWLGSLPAVALVSAGDRPSVWEQRSLPEWPVAFPTTTLDSGLPMMTLEWAGLLQPQALPGSTCVAILASDLVSVAAPKPRLAAVAVRHKMVSATPRIWARKAIYVRFKPPSRLAPRPRDTAVFIGGLY